MTISPSQSASHSAESVAVIAKKLCRHISTYRKCIIAFSGGVDSAVVAAAAARVLPESAIAVTAVSPSLSAKQLRVARDVARQIGIQHLTVATSETDRPEYIRNDKQRCYFCKETLYRRLRDIAKEHQTEIIISGTNADDLGDHRPGIEAGREVAVRTPLADLGINKRGVRQLAIHWGLSVWDAPASPCLSSRIAYGVEVTPERLKMVEQAETFLAAKGFSPLRVRVHADKLARIEIAQRQLPRLLDSEEWQKTVQALKQIGFSFVTVDMEGFRSGNLNQVVAITPPAAKTPSPLDSHQSAAE